MRHAAHLAVDSGRETCFRRDAIGSTSSCVLSIVNPLQQRERRAEDQIGMGRRAFAMLAPTRSAAASTSRSPTCAYLSVIAG